MRLLSSLARRTVAPRLRRDGRGWLLELAGDAPAPFDPRAHDPAARAGRPTAPADHGRAVAPARHRVAARRRRRCSTTSTAACSKLGAPFELWASLVLGDPAPRASSPPRRGRRRALPARGRAERARGHRDARPGARARSARARQAAVRPSRPGRRLARVVSRPDRLRGRDVDRLARLGAVGQAARTRTLRVVFAMLAGLAPLHAERLAARGGPSEAVHDPLTALRHLVLRPRGDRRDAARRRRGPARSTARTAR